MRLTRFLLLAAAILLVAGPVAAQVNLKNGNYYVSYTDLKAPDLEVLRTYNSKTVGVSTFGYGWGWVFDTYIVTLGDGGIMLHNHGAGGKTEFEPAFPDPDALSKSIDAIVRARTESGWSADPDEVAAFRSELRENSERRAQHWKRYLDRGLVVAPEHEIGTQWAANEVSGFETLTRTEDGYLLERGSTSMRFDDAGKLRWLDDEDGEYALDYDDGQRIARIESAVGSVLTFEYHGDDATVDRLTLRSSADRESQATYVYNGDDLVENVDAAGNRYVYEYDDAHNMTRIDYGDGTERVMSYDPSSYHITRLQERDGTVKEYEYFGDDDAYGTRVTTTTPDGQSATELYEWEIRTAASGRRWTYRIVQERRGVRTETTYNECCFMPVLIRRNGRETSFDYDARGNLIRKANEQEVLVNEYDLDVNKITRVERWTPDESRQIEWFEFSYTPSGDLARAEHSDGRWVELSYNDAGKIVSMESDESTLAFEYNAIGKPTRIEIEGVGGIDVTYDDDGEIQRVHSPEGQTVSMQVTQAFQTLLALVKPSGVNVGM